MYAGKGLLAHEPLLLLFVAIRNKSLLLIFHQLSVCPSCSWRNQSFSFCKGLTSAATFHHSYRRYFFLLLLVSLLLPLLPTDLLLPYRH